MAEAKARETLKQYFTKGKDSVEIVLGGKMGTGKSTLVNSIVGKRMAEEGNKALSVTRKIVSYTKAVDIPSELLTNKRTINVVVWDTPGLGDPLGDDEATAKEIAEKCKEVDLLLYCLDIRGRFANDDATGIKLLTKAVGQQMWKHAIFVLTFANEVEAKDGQDAATQLKDNITSWTDAIKDLMKNEKFPHDIADNISIIPAGYRCYPPPGIDDWFSPFWAASFIKTKPSAQPALLGINTGRLSSKESASKDHQGKTSEEPHEMPIRFSADDLLSMRTAVATGGCAGVGALIGLVAGAVGGPVTMPVGAAIGAAAGSGVGFVGRAILGSIFGIK